MFRKRQRLPLNMVEAFFDAVWNHLAQQSEPVWEGRRVFILDGTTFTLPPTQELKKHFLRRQISTVSLCGQWQCPPLSRISHQGSEGSTQND